MQLVALMSSSRTKAGPWLVLHMCCTLQLWHSVRAQGHSYIFTRAKPWAKAESNLQVCASCGDDPHMIANLDGEGGDTAVSVKSYEVAPPPKAMAVCHGTHKEASWLCEGHALFSLLWQSHTHVPVYRCYWWGSALCVWHMLGADRGQQLSSHAHVCGTGASS